MLREYANAPVRTNVLGTAEIHTFPHFRDDNSLRNQQTITLINLAAQIKNYEDATIVDYFLSIGTLAGKKTCWRCGVISRLSLRIPCQSLRNTRTRPRQWAL